jgi:hypothetical protein
VDGVILLLNRLKKIGHDFYIHSVFFQVHASDENHLIFSNFEDDTEYPINHGLNIVKKQAI